MPIRSPVAVARAGLTQSAQPPLQAAMGYQAMYWTSAYQTGRRTAWIVAGLLLLSPPAWAQTWDSTGLDTSQVKQLEAITVTAERPRAVAPPVTTIEVSAAELRRTLANDAYDLLRRTSGIEVHEQGQGPGFASDAVIRGFSSDHSSDVLLVMDGVPINLPVHGHVEGYSDWSILSPAGMSSLRVITGPASPPSSRPEPTRRQPRRRPLPSQYAELSRHPCCRRPSPAARNPLFSLRAPPRSHPPASP